VTATKKRVVILTRQQDGSWMPSEETYTQREAERLMQLSRCLAGIQSRTFPLDEYQRLHPEWKPGPDW